MEIDLEESIGGDLTSARRISLGDLDLPEPGKSGGQVRVELPSLGPGLQRQVRLFDRNGLLLDATDRLSMAEQINVQITMGSTAVRQLQIGHTSAVGIFDRLARAERAEAAYSDLLKAGLPGRLIDDPEHGLPALTSLLSQTRGHLDILDPYFGWDADDWLVLGQAHVPVRVLTGYGEFTKKGWRLRVKPLPPGSAPLAPSLHVRPDFYQTSAHP